MNHDKLDLQGRPINESDAMDHEEDVAESGQPSAAEEEIKVREGDSSDATDTESEDLEDSDFDPHAEEESKQDAQTESMPETST